MRLEMQPSIRSGRIILAAGMPRAGSGWHYNLVHDLTLAAGGADARQIRRRYRLQNILTEVNCNIGVLSIRRLAMVMVLALLGRTFAIKVHSGLTPTARRLIRRGWIRPTYIYRDPRDALLSAYEYGQRGLASGRPNAFSSLDSIEKAIAFMQEYVGYWQAWTSLAECHTIVFEALKTDYDAQAARLSVFLSLSPDAPAARAVIERYRPEQAQRGAAGLHFSQGISGRFREKLSAAQQEVCRQAFGDTLAAMGYVE